MVIIPQRKNHGYQRYYMKCVIIGFIAKEGIQLKHMEVNLEL
jgi:hypothetical protein